MNNIREIYTKAIVAKGKKLSRNTYTFTLTQLPDEILGCYVTNHHYEPIIKNRNPKIKGTFDIHVWYSYHDGKDTMVDKYQISYNDDMQVSKKDNRDFEEDDTLKARCLQSPKCLSSTFDQQIINIEIEKEMLLEISGETCIKVEVKNEDEVWDDFLDKEINPNFIK
ncbi:MAG: outer spore coat protein CotE [Erysipelotrichaceae bacterium]|nr:outer spore coat protein CotE [Erysipelotrichaceae bacterium]